MNRLPSPQPVVHQDLRLGRHDSRREGRADELRALADVEYAGATLHRSPSSSASRQTRFSGSEMAYPIPLQETLVTKERTATVKYSSIIHD